MTALLKSDLLRRFAGGFAAGALAIVLVQPPEGALRLIDAVKSAIA